MAAQEKKRSRKEEKKLPYGEWFYWLQTLVGAIVCIVLVFTFLGRLTRVDGDSMNPTLVHNELLAVWSLGYQPQAGDIVIANKTTSSELEGKAIVKRVIATQGQTVDIDYGTGTVYVGCIHQKYLIGWSVAILWPLESAGLLS